MLVDHDHDALDVQFAMADAKTVSVKLDDLGVRDVLEVEFKELLHMVELDFLFVDIQNLVKVLLDLAAPGWPLVAVEFGAQSDEEVGIDHGAIVILSLVFLQDLVELALRLVVVDFEELF